MTNFRIAACVLMAAEMSATAIDKQVAAGNFSLGKIVSSAETNDELPVLSGGWKASWVSTFGEGNRGELIVLPGNPRTYAIYQQGMETLAMRAGLNLVQAGAFVKARVNHKIQLLDKLVETLNNDRLRKAYPNRCLRVNGRRNVCHRHRQTSRSR